MWGLLAYRLLGMAYSLAVIYETRHFNEPSLKFLTRWGVWLIALYYAVALLSHASARFHRTAVVLYVTAWTLEFPICLVFWTWIHWVLNVYIPPFFNYSAHGGLLLLLVLELPLNAVDFQWKDLSYPIATAVAYQGVNLYYTVTSGPVYPGLNYSGAESALMVGYVLAAILGGYWLGVQTTKGKNKTKAA